MEERCKHESIPAYCAICNGDDKAAQASGVERRHFDGEGRTKQEWCDKVADLFKVGRVKMATGGSEPTGFWDSILRKLGLPVTGTKPEKARAVAASQGIDWPFGADSEDTDSKGGSTVTMAGWLAVHQAAKAWHD
jgi:hypothetical protein